MKDIPTVKPGDTITADWANRVREAIMEQQLVADPPLYADSFPGGTILTLDQDEPGVVVKITGAISGGTYPAKLQIWNHQTASWNDGANCEVILL